MTTVRIWRGVTLLTKAEQYLGCLKENIVPACQAAAGHKGLFIMKECQGELAHFLLLSFWASSEALISFAGVDCYEVVNLSPEERSLLIAFESIASHYSIVFSSDSASKEDKL